MFTISVILIIISNYMQAHTTQWCQFCRRKQGFTHFWQWIFLATGSYHLKDMVPFCKYLFITQILIWILSVNCSFVVFSAAILKTIYHSEKGREHTNEKKWYVLKALIESIILTENNNTDCNKAYFYSLVLKIFNMPACVPTGRHNISG